MSTLTTTLSPMPLPERALSIRPGVPGDIPFIDSLQRMHSKMVGWMPTKQLEAYIQAGNLLVAQDDAGGREQVGYCIGNDRYFKREDVGIIYQMNVAPGKQRGLVGATLLKALFERAAYGCKLFCCWCAQDIAANYFWESLGFVPLAFRAGSREKQRVHIFWQRRIRAGDTTTPYWFPSQTTGGALREDRLVLPIPPGTHWRDAKPLVLPGMGGSIETAKGRIGESASEARTPRVPSRKKPKEPAVQPELITAGGLRFGAQAAVGGRGAAGVVVEKPKREPKPPSRKMKNDPKLVAAARELRDRWLEQVNSANLLSQGKYDVSRELPQSPPAIEVTALPEGLSGPVAA